MKSATAESRSIENHLVSNLAAMRDDQAAGYRRALITAAARDLVWREGRGAAAEALYVAADHWATADLAESGPRALPAAPGGGDAGTPAAETDAAPAWRALLRNAGDWRAAALTWLSGFAAGATVTSWLLWSGMIRGG